MKRLRWILLGVGVVLGLYGAGLLLGRPADLVPVGIWMFGGVLLHDAVLAPLVIGICLLGTRLQPRWLATAAAITLIVFGSLTLLALPVLGRFGSKPDNPTLLDRNYLEGWLLLGVLIAAGGALIGSVLARRANAEVVED
ncbi:MAG: hypothetical protein ACRCYU_04045 [Nocardioides sp.]